MHGVDGGDSDGGGNSDGDDYGGWDEDDDEDDDHDDYCLWLAMETTITIMVRGFCTTI